MHYRYKTIDKTGKTSETAIEAESQKEATRKLKAQGQIIIDYLGEGATDPKKALFNIFKKKSNFNIIEFTNRLAPLLEAGIQLKQALEILIEGEENENQKSVMHSLLQGMHEGKKLSQIVKSNSHHFPTIYSNLIEVGEETGTLKESIVELQSFLNYRKEMKDFLITSSIYPAIILTVTLGVIIMLFTVFVPKFSEIFINMGKEIPLPMKIMLGISNTLTSLWWLWLLGVIFIIFLINLIKKGGKPKDKFHAFLLKLPIAGSIIQVSDATRFIKTLGIMIKNNVHLITAVTIATRVLQNRIILKSLEGLNSKLKNGEKLSIALSQSYFMPKITLQMLKVGEQTGQMGEMLEQVAAELERNMKEKIRRLLALFEPFVILMLAVTVLAVVVSIFISITEMNNI